MRNILLLALFSMIILAGCAPDPRNQADADNSRTLTAQQAANLEQARQIRTDEQARAMQAVQVAWPVIVFGVEMVAFALALSISFSLVGLGGGVGWAGYGLGKVAVRAAQVKANLIPADRKTRLFPLVIQSIGGGRYTMSNPNTGSVLELDIRRREHASLIVAAREVQTLGVAAYEFGNARHGSDETTGKVTELISQFEAMANRKASRHVTIPAE